MQVSRGLLHNGADPQASPNPVKTSNQLNQFNYNYSIPYAFLHCKYRISGRDNYPIAN